MRLSDSTRRAFVNAVMADVPYTDYAEQAQKLLAAVAEDSFRKAFPRADYQKLIADGWIIPRYFAPGLDLRSVVVNAPEDLAIPGLVQEQLDELNRQSSAQNAKLQELRKNVNALIKACPTSKALVTRAPELARYLPEAVATTDNLPAVSNVLADLAKAGWPAGKKPGKS